MLTNHIFMYHRAAKADNHLIVTRLLSEFQARNNIQHPQTGENILHICFKNSSKLRFHLVLDYPSLLKQTDHKGDMPLFIACKQNDTTFFRWLFTTDTVSFARDTPTVAISPDYGESSSLLTKLGLGNQVRLSQVYEEDCSYDADLDIPSPPPIIEVRNMQPFAPGDDGNSILHVLAEKSRSKILESIVRVTDRIEGFDFSALTTRHRNGLPLPIEKAMAVNCQTCVNVLIDLAIKSHKLPRLLEDKIILKSATVTKKVENVKALIKFGFHCGIELAITLAASYKLHDMVRLLIFWQVEIYNYLNFSHNRDTKSKQFDLMWKQFQLQHFDSRWLTDAVSATNMAVSVLTRFLEAHIFKENNAVIFQELGSKCIQYFEEDSGTKVSLPQMLSDQSLLTKIVTIKLSENHLEELPMELFQLSSLTCLDLKYNKLKSLPSSGDLSSPLYLAKLESICLDYNNLQCIPDDLLCGLANSLTSLSIQKNKLEEIPPGLWLMPKLSILKLANNKLSSLHHLSDPQFYKNEEIIGKIASFHVQDGTLKPPGNISGKEADTLTRHVERLASLQRTVLAIKYPDLRLRSRGDLFSEVIKSYLSKAASSPAYSKPGLNPTSSSSFEFLHSSLSSTPRTLGDTVFVSSLKFLDISHNDFTLMPWNLPCLASNLVKLDMTSNSIKGLDLIQDLPKDINNVTMKSNKISSVCQVRSTNLPCGCPMGLLTVIKDRKSSENFCKHSQHEILHKVSRLILDDNLLDYFPILKRLRSGSLLNLEYNIQANPLFPNLAILHLASNRFITVPKFIHCIKHLSSLNLSHNDIQEIPEEMGLINTTFITYIKLEGIKPRNVPESVMKLSSRNLVKYLRELQQR